MQIHSKRKTECVCERERGRERGTLISNEGSKKDFLMCRYHERAPPSLPFHQLSYIKLDTFREEGVESTIESVIIVNKLSNVVLHSTVCPPAKLNIQYEQLSSREAFTIHLLRHTTPEACM